MKNVYLGIALLATSAMANASIIVVLDSVTSVGANHGFNYQADLTNDEELNPAATNGTTCPGPNHTTVQCNPTGTFFTIYDIPGFVSASETAAGWTTSIQNLGVTPGSFGSTPSFDSASVVNVTYMYSGPVVLGPASFSGFQVVSTFSNQTSGTFTSQSTKDTGTSSGLTDEVVGSVNVPFSSVPEPASMLLVGGGLLFAGLAGRRVLGKS